MKKYALVIIGFENGEFKSSYILGTFSSYDSAFVALHKSMTDIMYKLPSNIREAAESYTEFECQNIYHLLFEYPDAKIELVYTITTFQGA